MNLLLGFFALHWWSPWLPVRIIECPEGELVTVELRRRRCLVCRAVDEEEVVLSCV